MESNSTERTIARMKSYVLPAVFVLFLYTLGWVPGFIVNLLYYNDAKRMERIAGEGLPGSGCLSLLLWANVAVVVLAILAGVCALAAWVLYIVWNWFAYG